MSAAIVSAAFVSGAGLLAPPAELELGPEGLETVPCWGPDAPGLEMRCGVLAVPESRERPNGRQARIAVAILLPEGTPADSLPAPLVHLAGGPGFETGLSGPLLAFWQGWYAGWSGSGSRALILVDQRGTGHSEPLLRCPEDIGAPMDRAYMAAPSPRDPLGDAQFWRAYFSACRAPFTAAGIDITAYNTAESAADFAALRRALGLAQWDVWGVSYGTELALELVRIDEAGIRSLILDSVSLYGRPGIAIGNVAASFDRAVKTVVRDCLADELCSNRYPALQSRFAAAATRRNYEPETLLIEDELLGEEIEIVVDGRRLAEMAHLYMYAREAVPYLPRMLEGVGGRNRPTIDYLARYMIDTYTMMPYSDLMQISAICRAAPRGANLARLAHDEGRFPAYAGLWTADYYDVVCTEWGGAPASPAEQDAVRSEVPALILGGRYDPITPPEWGGIVGGWLPNSTVVEFPHLAHASMSLDSCADAIAARFLDEPMADPRDGCLAGLKPPQFAVP